ncbi:MAG: phosphoribosyltransferase [Myxococcaceae bacterium]
MTHITAKTKKVKNGKKRGLELPLRAAEASPAGTDRSGGKSQFRELTWAQFDRLVQSLARQIGQSFKPEAVVGVAHGGVFVGGAIASALSCEFYPVRISRRSRDKVVRSRPQMFGKMPAELKGRRVLVVDDVAASGETLELARTLAGKVGAKEVATACLVSRPGGYAPTWTALPTDEFFVFPWDYDLLVPSWTRAG